MMARYRDVDRTSCRSNPQNVESRPPARDITGSFRRFLDLGNDAALTVDVTGKIHASCRSTTELFACDGECLSGRMLDDLFMEADVDLASPSTFSDMLNVPIRATARRFNGRTMTVELEIRPLDDESGDRFLVLIQPLSSMRRFEFELAQLLEQQPAPTETRHLDELGSSVALISHEIRTPMTAILGYADLLKDRPDDDAERHTCVDMIRNNGRYLLTLINDLLDLSKLQADRMNVNHTPCDPCEIVRNVAAFLSKQAYEAGLAFDVELGHDVPSSIITDPIRLRQILINLVGNAIKFTQKGRVLLACRTIQGSSNQPARLTFDVVDSGPGLTDAEIEQIFEPFSRTGDAGHHPSAGTGLGLTICRRLAHLLEGEIHVVSEPGQGSTFSVSFDLNAIAASDRFDDSSCTSAPPAQIRPQTSPHRTAGRILLAEDTPDTRRLVTTLLEQQGFDVIAVEDGRSAKDLGIKALQAGQPFDLILMDVQMPAMDGYSATNALRQAGYTAPIAALTANALSDEQARATEAGCDLCLTKPIERDQFIATVSALVADTASMSA